MPKISALPNGGSTRLNDIFPIVRGGVTDKASINSVFARAQIIYVDSTIGSDSANSNGSQNLPYRSVSYALSQITDATNAKPYTINCNTGAYPETNLILKPWVSINGNNSSISVVNPVTLDASWSAGGFAKINNFYGADFQGGINLDFSAYSNFCVVEMDSITTISSSPFNFTGHKDGSTIIILSGIFGFSGAPIMNVTDCYGGLSQTAPNGLNFKSSLTSGTTFVFNSNSNTILGDLSVEVLGTGGINFITRGTLVNGSTTLTSNTTALNYTTDCASVTQATPVIVGSQVVVNYVNVSNGITANYTPVNYTPVNPEVQGHLHGIDTALGNAAMLPASNIIYVSTHGSALGNGTLEKPFSELNQALTHLSPLANNVNNYAISIEAGQYSESAIVNFIPHVCIYSSSPQTSIILDNGSQVSTNWNTGSVFNDLYIENISFIGDLTFNFDSSTNTTLVNRIYLNNCVFFNNLFGQGAPGNSPFYNTEYYFTNCQSIVGDIVLDNGYFYINSNYFGRALYIGTNTNTCQNEFDLMNTICGTGFNAKAISNSFSTIGRIKSCKFSVPPAFDGTTTTIYSDPSIWEINNPVAGTANIIKQYKSNAILTNNPLVFNNFTPVDNSVLGALEGIDAALGTLSPTIGQSIYVDSVTGSDTTGNGSILNPFQSIVFALSTITTASLTNKYNLILTATTYNETSQIKLKPFVNIFSYTQETVINNSLPIIIDTALFNGTAVEGSFFSNFTISGDCNFDFSSSTSTVPVLKFINVTFDLTLKCNGNLNNSSYVIFYNCDVGGQVNIDNCSVISYNNRYISSIIGGSFTPIATTFFQGIGDTYYSPLSFSSGSFVANYLLNSCLVNSTISASNANTTVQLDTSSYVVPTVTAGANIVLKNVANGLKANYTPTNYTPTDSSVKGHLEGINNALSTTGLDSLQTAYNNGVTGQINAISGKPIINSCTTPSVQETYDASGNGVKYFSGLTVPNPSFTLPPTISSTSGTIDNYGFFFHPNSDLHAVKVGFLATELPLSTDVRLVGIFRLSDNALIASTSITGISDLDSTNTYRTEFISDVILSTTDTYFLQAVYPAGTSILSGIPTGIDSNITIQGVCSAVGQSSLTYPTTIVTSANNTLGSAVIFESDTTLIRRVEINSQGLKDIYGDQSSVFPVVTNLTGYTSATLITSFYHRIGNIIHFNADFSANPSATNGTISLQVPYAPEFSSTTDACGLGTMVNISAPLVNLANVMRTYSLSGSQKVKIETNCSAGGVGQAHLIHLSFSYLANQ